MAPSKQPPPGRPQPQTSVEASPHPTVGCGDAYSPEMRAAAIHLRPAGGDNEQWHSPNKSNCRSKQILRSLMRYLVGSSAFEIIWIYKQLQQSRFFRIRLDATPAAVAATATFFAPLDALSLPLISSQASNTWMDVWKPPCFWTSGLNTGFVCLALTSPQTRFFQK